MNPHLARALENGMDQSPATRIPPRTVATVSGCHSTASRRESSSIIPCFKFQLQNFAHSTYDSPDFLQMTGLDNLWANRGYTGERPTMIRTSSRFWQILQLEEGQDVAEYAVMLAVILAVIVGTIRMIGSGASNVFSSVASSIQ
jgi:Flp pilus assembly pilin Flp